MALNPVSFPQASWLLLRLQLIRFARQLTAGFRIFRRKNVDGKREATEGKSKRSWLLGGFVAVSISIAFVNIAAQTVGNIREHLGTRTVTVAPAKPPSAAARPASEKASKPKTVHVPLPSEPGFLLPSPMLKATTLIAALFLLASTLLAIANGELSRPDWDLEWLATLPLPLPTLLAARIAARSVISPMGLSALWPYLLVVAWETGDRWSAPFVGLAATLPLLAITATVQTLCDTGLRLRLGPSQLRNLQAAFSLIAVLALYLALSPGMPAKPGLVLGWAQDVPAWAFWTPPGLAIRMLAAVTPLAAAEAFGLLAGEALLLALTVIFVLTRELRAGIVSAGARESGRLERVRKSPHAAAEASGARWLLTPIQSRELRLLGRDRTFLVQTLVMPVVIIGSQIFFSTGTDGFLASLGTSPGTLAAIAFGISTYALMFSAFQTLNAEGAALWILYSVPQSLESVLLQKAALWGSLCLVYPLTMFGAVLAFGAEPSLQFAIAAALVFIGIPIFAVIATSLGVFACDPLAQQVQRRVKVSYVYLYMLISSTYVYSIYANTIAQRLALLTLTSLLAFALWQKARDQLPYLLDPAASPPSRVSVSDGLIAAQLFFVLQGIVLLIRGARGSTPTGFDLLIAFTIAGAVTFSLMRLAFWRLKSAGVPRTFGAGAFRSIGLGAIGGIVAAGLAFVYLWLAARYSWFAGVQPAILPGKHSAALFAVLAICAAPIFEEFIFRGLIFGGLRRSAGVAASVLASAAIFAIIHPVASVVPVFGLGIAAALVYERSRLLAGPVAAHAVYNALIVGSQFYP